MSIPNRMYSEDRKIWAAKYTDGWTMYSSTHGVIVRGVSQTQARNILDYWNESRIER